MRPRRTASGIAVSLAAVTRVLSCRPPAWRNPSCDREGVVCLFVLRLVAQEVGSGWRPGRGYGSGHCRRQIHGNRHGRRLVSGELLRQRPESIGLRGIVIEPADTFRSHIGVAVATAFDRQLHEETASPSLGQLNRSPSAGRNGPPSASRAPRRQHAAVGRRLRGLRSALHLPRRERPADAEREASR